MPFTSFQESAMTFAIRNLSVLAYAQGFTLWHYKGVALKLAETQVSGFFDGAADMLATGDMLMVSASDGGRVGFVSQASGRVTLTALA
jgi:hypothetical protein